MKQSESMRLDRRDLIAITVLIAPLFAPEIPLDELKRISQNLSNQDMRKGVELGFNLIRQMKKAPCSTPEDQALAEKVKAIIEGFEPQAPLLDAPVMTDVMDTVMNGREQRS